ncbi:MAG: hypothetical protein IIB77_08120 [Proteobacteria bacterium]|nr:hypothetical protein [Pseudomonadota bacterium]
MTTQRISFIDPASIDDPAMIAEFERCAAFGTPRPESQAIHMDLAEKNRITYGAMPNITYIINPVRRPLRLPEPISRG